MQCILCLRCKADIKRSYHCSADCLHESWPFHIDFHAQATAKSEAMNGESFNGLAGSTSASTLFPYHQRGPYSYSNSGEAWIETGRERTYTPTAEDVGAVLKFECTVHDVASPYPDIGKTFAILTQRVRPTPSPPRRMMVPLPTPTVSVTDKGKFTLLTYNVLADLYATVEQFPECPPWSLGWSYRRVNLLKELLTYDADILCLQEVQSNHFQDFLAPELQRAGYTAVYKKKTAEMYTRNAYAIDGCATFFKKDKFALVKKYEVEFNKAALSLADVFAPDQKKAVLNRILKDNVALIAVLEALEPPHSSAVTPTSAADADKNGMPGTPGGGGGGSIDGTSQSGANTPFASLNTSTTTAAPRRQLICVANTHIHSNPELADVKLWQVHTLLKGLEKIAASADIPMLVAGDFNATPGSAAHELLVRGTVNPSHPELSNDPLGILRPSSKLQHGLPLASAYAAVSAAPITQPDAADGEGHALLRQRRRLDPLTGEPRFTNFTRDFQGTLDYVFYSKDSLVPGATLELPDASEARGRTTVGLPNEQWSSDHIALMVEFRYNNNRSK